MTPLLPTTVVGSCSVPEWLGRLKTDYHQRRISAQHLGEIHEVAIKAALKDQERAGVDIVSDGELRRDNDIDYLLARIPGVEIAQRAKTDYYDYYDAAVTRPLPEPGGVSLGRVDALVLEFARKGLDDLRLLREHRWERVVGFGVIDVKTAEVEPEGLVAARIRRALEVVPAERLMINPDCGLRHLPADVARAKLRAMVAGTAQVRAELAAPALRRGR